MSKILKANPIVESSSEELKKKAESLLSRGVTPRLDVILVGSNPASMTYVRNKKKRAEGLGAICNIHHLDEQISTEEFLAKVNSIQADPAVHGCFVQLPLPKQLDQINTHQLIRADKDVDGFHPLNACSAFSGEELNQHLIACTPSGIIDMLDFYDYDLTGKKVVVIGRSMIVGRPVAMLCLARNATVTICHSRTKDLREETKQADIIISAIGKANFLDKSFLNNQKNQVVIDVGINLDENGKLVGDLKAEDMQEYAGAYSPVPGGVGPMTINSLMKNLFKAAEKLNELGN